MSDVLPCLGADGHDFEPLVPVLRLPRVRFVFPHAPSQPVTVNGGMVMPAWYDIAALGGGRDRTEDEAGIRRSAERVRRLVAREEERGVPSSRIVLAGFSQGGALALHVALRYERTLAGLMVLSAYEVLAATREAEETAANRATPILFAHGTDDPVVPVERGRAAYEGHAAGREALWREYPMEHAVCPAEIGDIRDWLAARLGAAKGASR
jgi:phospholipase/carboxylesterase